MTIAILLLLAFGIVSVFVWGATHSLVWHSYWAKAGRKRESYLWGR